MLRLQIILTFFLSINFYSQTESYLKQENSPESIEDIVKLLNLKNVRKISIYRKESNANIFLGEIILNRNGKCIMKEFSYLGNEIYHTYEKTNTISTTNNNQEYFTLDNVINNLNNTSINRLPRYKGNSDNYTYNSAGFLTNYLEKGFYLVSEKSREEEEFDKNELEYKLEYNKKNQIIKYYKRLKRESSTCEIITKFKYINSNNIGVESECINCKYFIPCFEKLSYRIKYY